MLYELCWLSQLGSYMKEDSISGIRVEKEGGAQSIIINSSGLVFHENIKEIIFKKFLSDLDNINININIKVDFESLDSIPSMLSDRSDLAFQPGSSGHISDHMNRQVKLFLAWIQSLP